ncbi:hypothetical protein NLX83_19140 [Allokutzneria sp. A3M-2-11 16]|uniref:thiopeptide maturation pyridine synthase n=1 Tax=Allokutzneria sp. A3M-2-11 16 TaxID=2962043 RepID=UPI0020B72EA2|nr:thiopeptide maturation pyridine synthase [Allokutzneria sp. A3M-2-11 16]MCP3801376.1 hypothetical protein [Allokutzneria sp. A3M-2-11 16]
MKPLTWNSIHVHYHDEDKGRLILEAVRPFFQRVDGDAYHLRHWKLGPHLRLNVRTSSFDHVRSAAEEIIGGFLERHPSTTIIDPEGQLPLHTRLAELEGEDGPLLPWLPNNSMHYAPYVASPDEDFYCATTELSFQATQSRPALLGTALSLIVATAHALSGNGITNGFISFRSHAEGFLNGFPEGGGLRPAWESYYRANAAALTGRVRATVATLDGTADSIPLVREWVTILRGLPEVEPVFEEAPEPGAFVEASPFHRKLFANPSWHDLLRDKTFSRYRRMLNLTYLHLTRLGITPAERFLLCHLAANAVEEIYGISAFDLIGQAAPVGQGVMS